MEISLDDVGSAIELLETGLGYAKDYPQIVFAVSLMFIAWGFSDESRKIRKDAGFTWSALGWAVASHGARAAAVGLLYKLAMSSVVPADVVMLLFISLGLWLGSRNFRESNRDVKNWVGKFLIGCLWRLMWWASLLTTIGAMGVGLVHVYKLALQAANQYLHTNFGVGIPQ